MSDGVKVDLCSFPPVTNDRELYFTAVDPDDKEALEQRGYVVVLLASLPRGTSEEERAYLVKKAQGVEAGTVLISEQQESMLRLLFKQSGLLDENRGNPTKKVEKLEENVLELIEKARSKQSRLRTEDTVFGRDVTKLLDNLEEDEGG